MFCTFIFNIERTFLKIQVLISLIQGVLRTHVSNLNTLSRRINILLLYTDCQSGRTAVIARHVSFAQITCWFSHRNEKSSLTQGLNYCSACDSPTWRRVWTRTVSFKNSRSTACSQYSKRVLPVMHALLLTPLNDFLMKSPETTVRTGAVEK